MYVYVCTFVYITPTKGMESNGTLNDSLNILAIGMCIHVYIRIFVCVYVLICVYVCSCILHLPKAWRVMERLMII
jgi:hypothetical protein